MAERTINPMLRQVLELGPTLVFFVLYLRIRDDVFVWGEPERIGFALQSLVRRADFDTATVETWAAPWIARHKALWKNGPAIDPVAYVPIENAKQVMRAVVTAISMERVPPPPADASRTHLLRALAAMR